MNIAAFEARVADGGVALFPADTVYGLATNAESAVGVERLYAIKGRPQDRPAAVMLFRLDDALAALPELRPRTRAALERLLPGPVTLVLPNPERRFPLAGGPSPDSLGLRVPDMPAFAQVRTPLLQSSANPSGQAEARRLADVDPFIRAAVDLELDGGELPGTPSTVVDLTRLEEMGEYEILRQGALPAEALRGL